MNCAVDVRDFFILAQEFTGGVDPVSLRPRCKNAADRVGRTAR